MSFGSPTNSPINIPNLTYSFQPRKKKPFIDKKNSVTFHLVHRSQKDPLAADDSAPQHVLMEAQPLNKVGFNIFITSGS